RQNSVKNMVFGSLIEPFQDFKITLNATKREIGDYQEIFRNSIDNPGTFESISPNRLGSYSITTIMIGTSFSKEGFDNVSPLFNDFENNRAVIKSRLDAMNPGAEYSINGQDVLIPAFLAAYRGKDASNYSMN